MALSLLFVIDPLDELKAYKDSSVAMMRVATSRGHRVFAATPAELAATVGSVTAHAHELRVSPDNSGWYEDLGAAERDLAEFDAVLMRKDPPFDVEFLNATLLLSRAAALGARVVNDAQALRDHNEKLSILEFPQFTVPTLVTREEERIRTFWADHEDIVVKPLDGMGGTGVFRLQPGDPNAGSILETVTARGARTAMAHAFR
jgi:glutathione synthase